MENATAGLIEEYDDIKPLDTPFLDRYDWQGRDTECYKIDITKSLPKPQFLLTANGIPFAMLKGFMCITGQAGNGKTATITLLVSAILKGEIGNIKYNLLEEKPQPTIVYIDTEQENYYTQIFAKRVFAMVGWDLEKNNDRLRVYNLREEPDNEDKWKDIIKIIDDTHTKATVIIIDGLLDTVNNQNDLEKCVPLINSCLAIASHYEIALWGVIHQNPKRSQDSGKMTGNLGSIAERKVSDMICTEKDRDSKVFTIKHLKARGKDIPDIKFKIDDSKYRFGIPTPIEETETATHEPTPEERKQVLANKYGALNIDRSGVSITQLKKLLNDKSKDINKGQTKDLKEAISLGVMSYDEITKHYYFHGITEYKQPTQTELNLTEDTADEPLPTEQEATNQTTDSNNASLPWEPQDNKPIPF